MITIKLSEDELKMIMCAIDLIIQNFGENKELDEINEKIYKELIKKKVGKHEKI